MRTRKTWRSAILTTAVALTALILGCERTKISDINKHPADYAGNEVTIAGKVTGTVASANPGAYQVDDGSGRIWVLSTSNEVPAQGKQIAVTGLVESKTDLGSTALVTALQEIRRYAGD